MKNYDKEVVFWGTLCLLYLFFRLVFMCIYNFKYTDQDQIVMWAGTVFISHGHLIEPMWLGQDYGSMLESLLALPLYWCKVPLYVALPISSLIISLFPMALLVIFCFKEKKRIQRYGILIILLLYSVDMDVLTSIPRTFIPGYCITVVGLLMCINYNKRLFQVIGGVIIILGIIMSETAICIVLPVLLCVLWKHDKIREQLWALIGVSIGVIIKRLVELFYKNNPEYVIWNKPVLSFDIKLFFSRFREFTVFFKNLIIFENAWLFCFFVIGLFLFLVVTKNIGPALTVIATLGGLFLTLGFSKIGHHDTVLWSPSRQFLFVPYNLAFAVYMSNFDKELFQVLIPKKLYQGIIFGGTNYSILINRIALSVMAFSIPFSAYFKYADYNNREEMFKTSLLNSVYSVDFIKDMAQSVYDEMLNQGFDFAIIDSGTYALATEALYDEKVQIYGKNFDRNNFLFLRERYNVRSQILEIAYNNGEVKSEIKNTGNRSAVQYIYDEYGIMRSTAYQNWDGKK